MKAKDANSGKINYCQICNSKKLQKVISMGSTGLCDSLLTKKQIKKGFFEQVTELPAQCEAAVSELSACL